MNVRNLWSRTRTGVAQLLTDVCVARDAHRGTAWERLSVAYPDPREARRAVELFRLGRLPVTAVTA